MTAHALKVPIGTAAAIEGKLDGAASLYREFQFHTVKKGETLTSIAKKYKVSAAKLRELNELSARAKVQARQELRIPSPSATALPAGHRGASECRGRTAIDRQCGSHVSGAVRRYAVQHCPPVLHHGCGTQASQRSFQRQHSPRRSPDGSSLDAL
jgi:LysM repeat protein